MNANDIIQQLNLQPHPEGGYYAETYRSPLEVTNSEGNSRAASTAIYFLLKDKDKSHFHRIKSDELWFFHQGVPLEIISIQNGQLHSIILGNDIAAGQQAQAMIPADTWFGSRLKDGEGYALVSCTVAPGFDFSDFELAGREELIQEFPHLQEMITELTSNA